MAERKGAPGVDRVSIRRWQRNWEERLALIAADVRANRYRPRPARHFFIPKSDGTWRQLSILTVTDRVLQRAVLRVVDDRFDHLFLDCSFGYRPGLGVRSAIPVILQHRDAGLAWVVDADVDECFGSLDHGLIRSFFGAEINDPGVLALLDAWLRLDRRQEDPPAGISMGAVISPLLCNLYLHRLDLALTQRKHQVVRYADDFCLFCASESEARQALADTKEILQSLRLRLEPNKTRLTHFDEGFDFLGVHFYRQSYSFHCNQKTIKVDGPFDPQLFYDYIPDGYEG